MVRRHVGKQGGEADAISHCHVVIYGAVRRVQEDFSGVASQKKLFVNVDTVAVAIHKEVKDSLVLFIEKGPEDREFNLTSWHF